MRKENDMDAKLPAAPRPDWRSNCATGEELCEQPRFLEERPEIYRSRRRSVVRKVAIGLALLLLIHMALMLLPVIASAGEASKPPLTNARALNLLVALRGLEGHIVIIKQAGAETQVQQPWDFGNALLRLRIKRSIQALEPIEKAIKDTREAMITEALAKMAQKNGQKPTTIEPGTPEFAAFLKQIEEMLEKPVDGVVDLSRIRASELKLDRNEIGASVLTGLDPILDDDVTPK